MTRARRSMMTSVAFVIALGVGGAFAGDFWRFVLTLAMIYSLASLSLVVLTGMSGQLNLHVSALGLGWGAYATFALFAAGLPPLWAILLAGVVSMPFAALVGWLAVRFRGLELAVATLAMGLIFERLFFRNIGKALSQRSSEITTPFESSFVPMERPSIGGTTLTSDLQYYLFCLVVAVVVFVLVSNLSRGASGRAVRALREREAMAETVGIPVIGYRVAAFAVSIAIAATAGGLFASLKLGIAPDSFNLDLSFNLLAATVIGGIRSPAGAVIGGSLAALLPEIVQFGPFQIFEGERLFLLFGVGMVLALWRLPDGLVGLARRRGAAPSEDVSATPTPVSSNGALADVTIEQRLYASPLERSSRPTLLRTADVRVRFGGVTALDGVSITIPTGEICALIGPNGAGKSTLFNVVGGLLEPDEGRVYFDGRDVTELAAHRRAGLGIGRTFQTVEVFRDLTVLDNLRVAGHRLRTSGPFAEALAFPARASERILMDRARELTNTLGLQTVADRRPRELPLGLLRVLDVGMALMPRPSMLLLDEPSAGLDVNETGALAELIQRVRGAYGLSVLLVEHDMTMVGRMAEHVYVLDFGHVIAEGTPQKVRRDPEVLEKYLGADRALFTGGARARR